MRLHAQEEPLEGPMAMALDEVLLGKATGPLLRTWCWAETTISIGCFVRIAEARTMCGEAGGHVPVVRRWTGGGCVVHEKGRDFSYSLIFPRGNGLASLRPAESYARIHRRLAGVLRECGIRADVMGENSVAEGRSRDCFRSPVPFDVLGEKKGEKISGAGQKRTRQGMLHQGNVRVGALPPDFSLRLARAFADHVVVQSLEEEVLAAARELAAKKYASADWTEKY